MQKCMLQFLKLCLGPPSEAGSKMLYTQACRVRSPIKNSASRSVLFQCVRGSIKVWLTVAPILAKQTHLYLNERTIRPQDWEISTLMEETDINTLNKVPSVKLVAGRNHHSHPHSWTSLCIYWHAYEIVLLWAILPGRCGYLKCMWPPSASRGVTSLCSYLSLVRALWLSLFCMHWLLLKDGQPRVQFLAVVKRENEWLTYNWSLVKWAQPADTIPGYYGNSWDGLCVPRIAIQILGFSKPFLRIKRC